MLTLVKRPFEILSHKLYLCWMLEHYPDSLIANENTCQHSICQLASLLINLIPPKTPHKVLCVLIVSTNKTTTPNPLFWMLLHQQNHHTKSSLLNVTASTKTPQTLVCLLSIATNKNTQNHIISHWYHQEHSMQNHLFWMVLPTKRPRKILWCMLPPTTKNWNAPISSEWHHQQKHHTKSSPEC